MAISHRALIAGLGIVCASPGIAQQAAAPAEAETAAEPASEIIVTGTRIVRDGYDAPTPVSVIGTKELKTEAPANIADFVNTLPSVKGSSTASNSSGSLSNGLAGVASIGLRGLGATRTLVLFDGQRSVSSATSGVVDVNTFPQALIERVEVVTGGASSAYGSDAVSGVVNFILDKKFEGLKGEYEHGVTTYDDSPNDKFTLTAGMPFAGGKGHILVSGEYFRQRGVDTIARKWNDAGFFMIDNPAYTATNGLPARLVQAGIGPGQFTPGGLISTGPFRGTYFGTIDPATGRAATGTLAFGPTNGQWMVGGDYLYTRQGHLSSNSLAPHEDRKSIFGRLSYEFSPTIEVFVQGAYSRYQGQSFYQQTPSTGVTLQVASSATNAGLINAYLPTSFVNSVNAYNTANPTARVTTVAIGTSNAGIPAAGSDNTREVYRFVAGAGGSFGLGSVDVKWDAYFQHGVTKTNELLTNTWNTAKMGYATDAVVAPAGNAGGVTAGSVTCRALISADAATRTAAAGCVPINRIGIGGVTQAALNYIFNGGNQPLRQQTLKQDVAALNFSTQSLFENWAGPVGFAIGAEYRKESVSGVVDPQFNTGWLYGNYLVTAGSYNVKEAYAELLFPVLRGMDFNGAVRVTNYSTSGTVTTWKAGLTYQPIPDIKLRGTVSRDIRAPNLGELFAPGTARTNTVNVPLAGGAQRTDQFTEQTVGNALLTPEVAKTYGVGVVLTPGFLPGFAASIDYYDITLSGAINTLTAQQTVTLCYEQANAEACRNITTTAGAGVTTAGALITGIRLVPINFVSQKSRGIDFEASYRADLGPGKLTFRALATHYISYTINNGIDAVVEAGGVNYTGDGYGNTPKWTYRVTETYDIGNWSFNVTGRGLSGGKYNNSFVECQTACPASTVTNRTINNNRIPGAFYLDFQTNYSFEVGAAKAQAFLSVRNLFNRDPVLVGNGPTGNNTPAYPQTNRNLYDFMGRVFRFGVRLQI
jgi:iron complex outermembrane recepter protein